MLINFKHSIFHILKFYKAKISLNFIFLLHVFLRFLSWEHYPSSLVCSYTNFPLNNLFIYIQLFTFIMQNRKIILKIKAITQSDSLWY